MQEQGWAGGFSELLNVCDEQHGLEMTDWGEGRAQTLVDDTQRPGSQPRANESSSLRAPLSLHAQRGSHAFPVLDVQAVVATVLSTLIPFRMFQTSAHRQNMAPGRTYAHGLLEGGGMNKDDSPHLTATHAAFSGVTLR